MCNKVIASLVILAIPPVVVVRTEAKTCTPLPELRKKVAKYASLANTR
jgi:hypothetical protein